MPRRQIHRAKVLGSPWPGVFSTEIESAVHFDRHWHASYGLGVLDQGAHRSASGRGSVDALAGDLITTNPGEVHDGRPLGGETRRWRIAYLEPAIVADLFDEAPPWREFTRPVMHDPALRDALVVLLARLWHWTARPIRDVADRLACDEALVALAALLPIAREGATHRRAVGPDIAKARDRLGDAWRDPPSLAELAATAGLSKFQLLRRFKSAYGLPPYAWLLVNRAERARGHIRAGLGLADAAALAGFADQSHMCRTFQRSFGFTPGAWREAVRAGSARSQ